jgi:hypothetical protein
MKMPDTLTFEQVEALLKRFTYKPNWRIEARYDEMTEQITVRMTMYVLDSRGGPYPPLYGVEAVAMHGLGILKEDTEQASAGYILSPRAVGNRAVIPDMILEEGEHFFWVWLRTVINSLERHESDEWFQVDGEPMFDPHKEK